MWFFVVCIIFYVTSASSWVLVPTCHMAPGDRWNIRHELDKLSRFTGHDQLDKYTKNWMRQQARKLTIPLAIDEKVSNLRLMDGNRLAILSDKRRWEVDLLTETPTFQHKLRKNGKYSLSMDGTRLYHFAYEPSIDCHVVKCNGSPVLITQSFPYHVTESLDGHTACVGLCSENVMVASLDTWGLPQKVELVRMNDVALASVGIRDKTFHGLLGGQLVVRDGASGERIAHTLRRQKDLVAPSVRSMDVEMFGFEYACYLGRQDGVVTVCRYDETPDGDDISEVSSRLLHRSPVTKIRCSYNRVASADDDGHVIVTDMHGTKTMYSMLMDGPGDVCLDLNQRFLVVGRGNLVHVWDHDHVPVVPVPFSRPKKNKGGGGRSVLR